MAALAEQPHHACRPHQEDFEQVVRSIGDDAKELGLQLEQTMQRYVAVGVVSAAGAVVLTAACAGVGFGREIWTRRVESACWSSNIVRR